MLSRLISLVRNTAARDFRPDLFVEARTLFGDVPYAQRNDVRQSYSIDLAGYPFERGSRRFRRFPHIPILYGASGRKIATVLENLDKPCLFPLDAN